MNNYSLLSKNANDSAHWNNYAETMPRDRIDALHLKRLKNLLVFAYTKNKFYKDLYDRHKVDIESIKSLDDFKRIIPLTDKPMIQKSQTATNLYGDNLSTDESFIVGHYATSGTTGKPLMEAWEDYAIWRVGESWCPAFWSAGIRADDTFYFAYDFGSFAGFWSAYFGVIRFGAKIISGAGVGMTSEKRIQQIQQLKPTVLVATPTYALHLANTARKLGIDPKETSIKFYVGAGEPGTASVPKIRERMEDAWGCGCAEVLGISEPPVVCPTCREGNGFHEHEMHQFAWVRDVESGEEVMEGQAGERIVTCLSNYSTIWINYRSHDVVMPTYGCPCGCTWIYYKGGVLGRTDHMLSYKGTNVYQATIEDIISSFPGASDYFQLLVRREDDMDCMSVRLEPHTELLPSEYDQLSRGITHRIKEIVGVTIPVEIVPLESLPRYEVKTKRMIDERPEEYKLELARKYKSMD